MSNTFGRLLNLFRQEKQRVTDDMVYDLLRRHAGFTKDDLSISEIQFPEKLVIRVSLDDGPTMLDCQTATIAPSFQTTIVREANYPDYHPDHPDNKGKTFPEIQERLAKESQGPDEEEKW